MEGTYSNAGYSVTTPAQGKGEVIIKNNSYVDAAHFTHTSSYINM